MVQLQQESGYLTVHYTLTGLLDLYGAWLKERQCRRGPAKADSRRNLDQVTCNADQMSAAKSLKVTCTQNAVRDACRGAGLEDTTAARFHEMAFYATYAVETLVRKSGQSAFTWVPLQGVTQCALNSVHDAERPAFTQSFIGALTGVSQPLQSLLLQVVTHH